MCITLNEEIQLNVLKKLETEGFLIGYKILWLREYNKLTSQVFASYVWKPGWNAARLERNVEFSLPKDVGIHVYLDKEAAECTNDTDDVVVPVKCYAADIVVAGYDNDTSHMSAVFKRVWLDPADYENIFQLDNAEHLK